MSEQFRATLNLYQEEKFTKIQKTHVLIIGIGGVGSWSAEALIRSGVQELTLVDLDEVCVSNINRQIHATHLTLGQMKTSALKDRLLSINPEAKIHLIEDFCTATNVNSIITTKYNYVIDAIDSPQNKARIILRCLYEKIPFITVGASGRKFNPALIQYGRLEQVIQDRLLGLTRKELKRKQLSLQSNKIPCIFSTEQFHGDKTQFGPTNCQNGLGTAMHITASFGLMAAGWVLNSIE